MLVTVDSRRHIQVLILLGMRFTVSPVSTFGTVLWGSYAAFLAVVAVCGLQSDLRLGYPAMVVALFAAAYAANIVGVVAYILGAPSKRFISAWRAVVPISVAVVCASAVLDESQNLTKDTGEFLLILSIFVASLAPGYFANFRVAYGARG